MRLRLLGPFHQCRLSFMRILLRRLQRDRWTFDRPVFDIDERGVGVAVYAACGQERTYSLVCFGHDLPPDASLVGIARIIVYQVSSRCGLDLGNADGFSLRLVRC
jgi:hypothetical protein